MRVEQVAMPIIRQVVSRPKLATAVFRFDKWGNPFDDESITDPYPMFERMRADGPVSHRLMYQQWFVTGYEEARVALSSDAFGTSHQMDVLLDIRPFNKLSRQAKDFMSLWLLLVDPPDHTRLRRLVNRAFTPRRVSALQRRIEQLVDELLAAIDPTQPVDIMQALCNPLPVAVIAELLGLPRERWEWSQGTTEEMVKLLNPFEWFEADALSATIAELHEYWGGLADERLADPQDDLLTALVQAEDEGDRLTRQELIAVIAFLMGAGHETTTNLLGNSIINLARNPDQRALVRADPELWPNAVEELIRFDTSVKIAPRATIREVELGGHTIPAGHNVLVELAAANRDPRRFDRPNDLLLDRDDPAPISFGHGLHHCLGAALARMELRIGLAKLLDVMGEYSIVEESIEWKRSSTLRGPSRLEIQR